MIRNIHDIANVCATNAPGCPFMCNSFLSFLLKIEKPHSASWMLVFYSSKEDVYFRKYYNVPVVQCVFVIEGVNHIYVNFIHNSIFQGRHFSTNKKQHYHFCSLFECYQKASTGIFKCCKSRFDFDSASFAVLI